MIASDKPTDYDTTSIVMPIWEADDASLLADSVESVLAQLHCGNIELIISDDTRDSDQWRDIISMRDRNPTKVRLLFSPKPVRSNAIVARAIAIARGAYLAFVEPDAVWIDELKLHKQIRALEEHPNWSACFHDLASGSDPGGETDSSGEPMSQEASVISLSDDVVIPRSTGLYRSQALQDVPWTYEYAPNFDWPLALAAASKGPLGLIHAAMTRAPGVGQRSGHTLGRFYESLDDQAHGYLELESQVAGVRVVDGRIWDDGWTTPSLALSIWSRETVNRIGFSIHNAAVSRPHNAIVVSLGDQVMRHDNIADGDPLELAFEHHMTPGNSVILRIESAIELEPDSDRRKLGFVLADLEIS